MIKDIIKIAVETASPLLKHEGARQVCKALNSNTLREILYKHHDDYGEFNYEEAVKNIRKIAINKAKSFKVKPQDNH